MVNTNNKRKIKKIVVFVARIILGGIFIYASIDKIAFPADFASSIQSYNILPNFLINPIALALPWIELIFGIFLVAGLFIKESALLLTFLILVFMIALGIRATKGPIEDCGCFGKLELFSNSNIYILFGRDFAFLSLGLVVLFSHRKLKTAKGTNLGKRENI